MAGLAFLPQSWPFSPGRRLLAAATLLVLAGCQQQAPQAGTGPGDVVVREIKQVPADGLPIGGQMPPLDEGRLLLAPPEGWYVAPRRRGYVVQFYHDKLRVNRIPRIWVTVEASPYASPQTVTEQNAEAFAQQVAEHLADRGIELIEPVRPMIIGGTPCARYVRLTTFNWEENGQPQRMTAERQVLDVLVDGRLYTIDLHVPPQKMLAYRDAAYAVAASMEFPQAGKSGGTSDDSGSSGESGESASERPGGGFSPELPPESELPGEKGSGEPDSDNES